MAATTWGSWIGQGIARGEPWAIIALVAVPLILVVTYRLMAWWKLQ
jgi:hypothetical protein